ncbi:MAG: hypothetical protein M3389_16695, partial [Actinomycetota bacterium]|nr:hypothetical protein [Actinomycetota bacterium]
MSNRVLFLLRLLGAVLFAASLAAVVYIVAVGPDQVAEQMGKSCRRGGHTGPSEWCHWRDVLDVMEALPYITLVGAVFMFVMRPALMGKNRKDEETTTPPTGAVVVAASSGGGLKALGVLAVIVLVVANFAGTFVYRAGYTTKTYVGYGKEYLREAKKADEKRSVKPAAAKPAVAPRGLARGSLLRTAAFRSAMAE